MTVYTPPKYQEAQLSREAPLKLEDRLMDFLMWLEQHRIYLSAGERVVGTDDDMKQLVEEYVNG